MSDLAGGFEPLSVRRGVREPFRLVEGIPDHAKSALQTWCGNTLRNKSDSETYTFVACATLRFGISTSYVPELVSAARRDSDRFLDLLDYLVGDAQPYEVGELELLLESAGSAWKVSIDSTRLERRVPAEAQEMYERVIAQGDDAAHRMSEAWRNMFGREVDARQAWHEAICAVEAALGPIVIPKGRHQLGTIVPAIRQAPEGKFTFRLPGADPRQTLLDMLAGVTYQPGRHAAAGDPVDQTTAKAVVFQAAAIVAAVAEGAVTATV